MNIKHVVSYFGILVIGIVLGVGVTFNASSLPFLAKGTVTNQQGSASLMIDFENGSLISCSKSLSQIKTVFDLLQACSKDTKNPFELSTKDYPGMGIFVNAIGGQSSTDQRYWQYWVNNQYATVSASSQAVHSGDVVEWKLINGQF